MKMTVIKNESSELIVEFDSGDLTVPDLIANQLLQNESVEFAGVSKEHPEVGKARLALRTGKKKASAVFAKALEEIEENIAELQKQLPSKGK
ncbi:MAG: hypothetical protein LVQ95_02140 [Candidatus Micrarchaeales archaeon]|nr:hypothetical protein [Candidatus Micrarchaeales archaeon]